MRSPAVILIPMRIERNAIERELRAAAIHQALVIQTGIGKDAILRAVERVRHEAAGALFVLAGAAGGLLHLENPVPTISRVIDEQGNAWTPKIAQSVRNGVTLIAVDRIIASPADKHALAQRTGAAIVDMESHAFAAFCERHGLRWTVVRGVSDTPDETLPGEVLEWITPEGETRNLRAARDLLLKPWLIPHIVGVMRRSNRVLPLVGRAVVEVVRAQGVQHSAGFAGAAHPGRETSSRT